MNSGATRERGFIALMSVIIISAVLLVLMFMLDTSSFFSRFDTLDTENKAESESLAQACTHAVMLDVARDPAFEPASGGTCVSVGGICGDNDPQKVCTLCSVTVSGHSATAKVRAAYEGAYTDLTITFNTTPGDFAITNWVEDPVYSGAPCVVP